MAARRLIEKTRARLENEVGAVYKSHAGRLSFALAFPSTYNIGMSNLGFQMVYRLINDLETAVCERVFLPDKADLDELIRFKTSLFTMESQTPVRDFDVLAFSLSFELDYPNVLKILSLSGIPELAADRDADDWPLVIAGGPAATFNPEPMSPFIDAFVLGEAEETVAEITKVISENIDSSREELLLSLAGIDGVYVPRFYEFLYNDDGTIREVNITHGAPEKIRRRWTPELDLHSAASAILTPETEFSNMILAEVARGCGRHCRFCMAGYAFLPPRSRSAESVLADIAKMEEKAAGHSHGNPRIGLMSASVFDHPSSLLICQSLAERDRLFSISSTRADTLNKDITEALHRGGHETLTIAPEAGTDRLRRVINKTITHEEIIHAAEVAWSGGFKKLKLYFMLGLPSETDEDISGIGDMVSEIAGMFSWEKIGVSVGCFVPKPWTPFQWAPMDGEKELSDKRSLVQKMLRPIKRVEQYGESSREAVVQGVLARGDRRLKDALLALNREGINWRAAFRESGIDPGFYAQRPRHRDEIFPWDHLDLGVKKEYLWQEYQRAMSNITTAACKVGICRRCGVCHD